MDLGTLTTSNNVSSPSNTVLAAKSIVGLYFSAGFCQPCKSFTPILAAKYNEICSNTEVEIIMMPKDKDLESFEAYFAGQPWYAANLKVAAELFARYAVKTIPALIFVDSHGDVICRDGRSLVRDKVPEEILYELRDPSDF